MRDFSRVGARFDFGEDARARFAADVQYYLNLEPRQLPSQYLYDALGSALFDAICHLPWYRLTRAEHRLLEAHAGQVFQRAGRISRIVELGPGNGDKLARLIASGRTSSLPLVAELIDVSASALDVAARAIGVHSNVRVELHEASYEAGLIELAERPRGGNPLLLLFLGSSLGNFDGPGSEAFLRSIRASLRVGDSLLLGTDLVKPEPELVVAYDDPLGVTAAFNKNVLCRINRELGGNFDLRQFEHRAVWNAAESRVEMHLVSRCRQQVAVADAEVDLTFEEGESIWTESSYKYEPDDVKARVEDADFETVAQWIEEEDRFALTLAKAV